MFSFFFLLTTLNSRRWCHIVVFLSATKPLTYDPLLTRTALGDNPPVPKGCGADAAPLPTKTDIEKLLAVAPPCVIEIWGLGH